MRLEELYIKSFKNLHELRISFDADSPYTVLVGENGSGKSNLIEAITLIFRNLDLDMGPPFYYQIRYTCRGHQVYIDATSEASQRYEVRKVGEEHFNSFSRRQFLDEDAEGRPLHRPAFVFGYYSGPSNRLGELYELHREAYYRWIIKPRHEREDRPLKSNARRRLFYAQNLHGQFALLAFFMEPPSSDDDRAFLRDHLQIDALDSVLFALRRPPWTGKRKGDPRFWHAEGEVRDFLGLLYDAALLPMRMERRIRVDVGKDALVECLYLFLPRPKALEGVYRKYANQYAFFTALESTYISKVLHEVRTRVRMVPAAGGGEVTYRDLSEGEQQLLLVLGLLKFTAEDETLFLLDEPDTHLNPAWSTQYLAFLDRFIRGRASCHIVMSTHDPLVFSGLRRDQVRIFRRDGEGRVSVEVPLHDPRGMGVQAILTSDLFRLATTLDAATQHDLDVQRRLAAKATELTVDESKELAKVNARLDSLQFTHADRDPLISLFRQKWAERERPEWVEATELTPLQIRERELLAEEIVAEIAATSGGDQK